ncbi:hypothetical protein FB562_0970 [Homoserinimonas aerilata]|uniref:CT398-like coiled coil hairpin domain-containing protein n=1 Tax=Homoserinimonas aerilata TaxID=1162970 RepID=A0A542YIH9_9MICO|nr:hypothetical protein [Homoserinimonas aerilata]TQL47896.1 hypothetical protein FB562_0970 [Homoserinimonas aerilata]
MALTASPDSQELLLELQAADTRIQQLDHQARSIPQLSQLAALSKERETVRVQLLGENGAVEDARLEISRVESDVAVVEARMARDSERLATSSSTKDVAALEQELEALRRRRDELEEIELGVMERLEQLEATSAITQERNAALLAAIAETEDDRDTALSSIDLERSNAAANRDEIAAKIPEGLLALYERQRARYGTGASLLRGGVSSASGVRLNESDMASIRAAAPDAVVLCPDSQAILVRTAESGL